MQIEELYKLYLASTGITTDTRKIAKGNIFFALKGDKFNANTFAETALNKGAAYVVVDELVEPKWKTKYGARFILLRNVLRTLQQLAGYHRQQLKCPVLAITGSNGKTTTKELIAAVLSKKYKTFATKGNLNNHIGVPLTLLSIKGYSAEFAVIEMGANHQGEIASYCEYTKPDYGLITNIGSAHLEGFGGIEGVLKGKTELYRDIASRNGKVFINSESETLISNWQLTPAISGMKQIGNNTNAITYGKAADAYCNGEIKTGTEFLTVVTEGVEIKTNLVGDYNFENVMSAICVGKYFGVELPLIKEAIENYTPTNNRSQKIVEGTTTIILDAYNANPSSMLEAIKNFEKLETENKVAILGQMMELGEYSRAEHEKIFAATENLQNTKRVFVGAGFEFVNQLPATRSIKWFETTEDLAAWYRQQQFENTSILIKGSRKNELEKILQA